MTSHAEPSLPSADQVVIRLADEGVPISAMARALRRPFADLADILREAREAGVIVMVPASDWPPGTARADRRPTVPPQRAAEFDDLVPVLMQIYRLTPSESRLIATLLRRPDQTRANLHAVIQRFDRATEPRIVDVLVCRLRKKLGLHQIRIETLWGRGFLLPPASREALLRAIADFDRCLTSSEAAE